MIRRVLMRPIYISDMDGTLLASGGALSSFTANNLRNLLPKGLQFTVASARSYTSVQNVFKDIPLKLPIITHDGALIYDLEKKRPLTFRGLDATHAREIYEIIKELGCVPIIECVLGSSEYFIAENLKNAGMKWLYDYREMAGAETKIGVDSFKHYENHILSYTLVDEAEPLLNLEKQIKKIYGNKIKTHFYTEWDCYQWCCLTIHDAKANKGQGLRDLMEILDCQYKDITVFGDNHNDLAMFLCAGRSIAVANAVPELISNSTHQIGHHNEDSVIRFIFDDFLPPLQ